MDFLWDLDEPAAGVPADNFSVRWTGTVTAPVTGTYYFSTLSDDGVRLWINDQRVISNWTDHGTTTDTSAGVYLQAGENYAIKLEYFEASLWATIRLRWSYPGQSTQVIPQSVLLPD